MEAQPATAVANAMQATRETKAGVEMNPVMVSRGLWIIRGAPLAKGVIPSIFVNVRTINAAFLLLRSMFQGAALGA